MEQMKGNLESIPFSNPNHISALQFFFDSVTKVVPSNNFSIPSTNTCIHGKELKSGCAKEPSYSTNPQNSNSPSTLVNQFGVDNSMLEEEASGFLSDNVRQRVSNCPIPQYLQSIKELEKVLIGGTPSNELAHWIACLVCFSICYLSFLKKII